MGDDARTTDRILSDEPFYTIGQVATLLGVPAAQLRRLDALEIVQPDRSRGNQRRYSADEIERLREVLALGEEGVTLPGVRKILELRRRVDELEDRLARQTDDAPPSAAS
ncbi:MerR family transcriptional regulator [Microbacterium sp. NPDC003461]